MNRNPKVVEIQQSIKKQFSLSEENIRKRKESRDANPRARKRKHLTHDQREKARQSALQEFVSPTEQVPTADQENYKDHINKK
jgi:hypothetical protein